MKFMIPPLKPHFFKPILAGFKNGIRIPTSFSEYVIRPEESYPEEALLKKNGRVWRVNVVNGHFTGQGWRRFAQENCLEAGGFLVFEHLWNMVFNAMVFSPITECGNQTLVCTKTEFEVKREVLSDLDEEEEVKPDLSILNMPNYFISTIKLYTINWAYLRIPAAFARSFGLANGSCEVIVKDGRGRSWYMDLKSNDTEIRMRRGSKLHEFFTANGFKEGDSFKFEVVAAGNGDRSPVVRITPHVLTMEVANRDSKRKRISTEVIVSGSESENGDYPCFTSKIRKYSAMNQCLCIPLNFARANGFIGKQEMILMNERGRRWGVNLRSASSHFRITVGWKDFRDDNGFKEGDAFKFEVVGNGAVPVVRFTAIY